VDQIDPKQHEHIDREYAEEYPLTKKGLPLLAKIAIVLGAIAAIVGIGFLIHGVYKNSKENE
jgi:hypothetical protein